MQGSPLLTLAGVALLAGLALQHSREKPTARAPAYSAESALLLAARAVPSAPPLSTTAVAAVLKKLLFFLSALVLVNFLGMA